MTWLIFLVGFVVIIGLAYFGYQTHQAKMADFAEAIRIRIKAQGGQEISVDKIDAPHLSGAILFAVGYVDADGRQVMNRVTIHTAGEYKFKQFWGEPVTPL